MTETVLQSDVYRTTFDASAKDRSGEASWLGARREESLARFETLGFPTTRLEAWKYTNVAPIARTFFRRPVPQGLSGAAVARLGALKFRGAFAGREIVFVNGRHAPELSSTEKLQGVEVTSLGGIVAREPERLEGWLGSVATDDRQAFTALNAAFFEDGAFVHIAPGTVTTEPIHLLFLSTNTAAHEPIGSHLRSLIVAGRGSQTTIVETYGGPEAENYFTNAVTEVVVEDGAVLDHYTLQRESDRAFHVATLAVRQGRASHFSDQAVSVGAALSRNDINTVFAGEGGECTLNGLFMAQGDRHTDTHTRIDHANPHCSSRELYKGVLDGKARGVFHGTVLVRKDAQKTDAYQVNKNLLLSREALVQSTPALEIHADDVKCKHGSTTGQLDANQLFYLRARGIGEEAARGLLIYAFASDIVGRIKVQPIRAALEAYLRDRLPSAPQEDVA